MSILTVKTKYGTVSGVCADGNANITQFLGVPYAAPPVGSRRWMPPAPVETWSGVLECTEYRNIAMQAVFDGPGVEPVSTDFKGVYPSPSEDCLYLNITTPAENADEGLPVYMWFHGGGLSGGMPCEIEYDPVGLARRGIIVVTVAQRLNIFGYLCLPQLTAEQGRSGNYGLMDSVAALDWVYENIASFGGDPNMITIGGQSGGTWKTGALVASPRSRRRVRRVIQQSDLYLMNGGGFTDTPMTLAEAEVAWRTYLKNIGVDPDASPEELRALDARCFYPPANGGLPMLSPDSMVCDGDWVPSTDVYANMRKYANECDYLAGVNFGECSMRDGFTPFPVKPFDASELRQRARELLGELYDKYDFDASVQFNDGNADYVSRRLAALGLTRNRFIDGVMPIRIFGKLRAEQGGAGKTFAYLFSRIPPSLPEEAGTVRDADIQLAFHSCELWYTFDSLRDGRPPERRWQAADFETARMTADYWANFIRTGDPNGDGLPYWPESNLSLGWLEISENPLAHTSIENSLDNMIYHFVMQKYRW